MFTIVDDNPLNRDNEFNSSYYKDLIAKDEGKSLESDVDDQSGVIEAEVIDPSPSTEDDPFRDEELSDSMKLLSGKTNKGFDSQVNKILDLRRVQNDQSTDVVGTFKKLFEDLNNTYGLNIQFDFNSFTNTLGYIIEPKNMKAMECYLSESYSRIRCSLYIMYLNAIAQLSSQILDPRFIMSNSMSYQDKLILMRELFQYIESLDRIYEKVKVKDSDIRLRKISEGGETGNSLEDTNVQNFLDSLLSSIKKPQ